jgi:YbbR domain-containing protein
MEQKKRTKKIYDSKVFWVIVSLFCSLMMWAYVTSQDTTDKDLTFSGIAVEFEGQEELLAEKNLSITDVSADTVSIVVRGNRSTISKLKSSDIKAVIDVSDITSPNNMTWTYKIVFPSYINESEISIVRKTPDTINFTVIKNGSKTVEIKGSFDGEIADGCVAEEFVFDPETITIEGPEETINKIDHVWVSFGKDQKIDSAYVEEAEFTLRDKNDKEISKEGLRISEDTITATQPVLKTKEVQLKVQLVSGGGITSSDCNVSIDPASIKIAGDSRIIDEIEYIELGTIDLSSFDSGYEHTFAITLPDDVQNITGVTEATVKVEIYDSYTKTFTTSNIACKGVSNGYHATIDTKEVEITLRALSLDTLNKIKSDDIMVIADLSDYGTTTGQVIVNAKVSVSGHDNVGAVGDVRVTVTISKD